MTSMFLKSRHWLELYSNHRLIPGCNQRRWPWISFARSFIFKQNDLSKSSEASPKFWNSNLEWGFKLSRIRFLWCQLKQCFGDFIAGIGTGQYLCLGPNRSGYHILSGPFRSKDWFVTPDSWQPVVAAPGRIQINVCISNFPTYMH